MWTFEIRQATDNHYMYYTASFSFHREHASRSKKGMQMLVLPLYGGLPYSEQVERDGVVLMMMYSTCVVTKLKVYMGCTDSVPFYNRQYCYDSDSQ